MGKKDNQEEIFDEFHFESTIYYTRFPDSFKNRQGYKPDDDKILKAVISGTIREMNVQVGDNVLIGDRLMILDAMKMNNEVKALFGGKIKAINVLEGEMVKKNQIIVEFE